MSYNGSGTFNVNTAGQPVVTGTVISSTAFNALTADLATGLSTAITKDGQTTTTARIVFAQGVSSTLVTDATSATTGSIITAGGISCQKALWVGTTSRHVGATQFDAAITYGGVTLSNAVTGTGNMVLSASPTLTGTLTAAAANFSGNVSSATEFRLAQTYLRVATVADAGGWTFGGGYNFAFNSGVGWKYDSTGALSGISYNNGGFIGFFAGGSQAAGTAVTEVGRWTSTGLGIGTTNPVRKLLVSNGGAEGFEFGPGDASGYNFLLNYNRSTSAYVISRTYAASYEWLIGGTEKMRLDASGVLLLGETSSTPTGGGTYRMGIAGNVKFDSGGVIEWPTVSGSAWYQYDSSGALVFQRGGSEAARFGSDRSFLVGTTTNGGWTGNAIAEFYTSVQGASFYNTANGTNNCAIVLRSDYDASPLLRFYKSTNSAGQFIATGGATPNIQWIATNEAYVISGGSGGVKLTSGATAWASASDETLKTDLAPIQSGAEKVAALRAVTGRYKKDEVGTSRSFLIAQDVQKVLPEAVSVDADGTLSLRYTEVIPLLVAAINELNTRLAKLEKN